MGSVLQGFSEMIGASADVPGPQSSICPACRLAKAANHRVINFHSAVISLKVELHHTANPIVKVRCYSLAPFNN